MKVSESFFSSAKVIMLIFTLLFFDKVFAQELQWAVNYHVNNNTGGVSVKTDNGGNVFVIGSSGTASVLTQDFILIKYDTRGKLIWANMYNGSGNGDDNAADFFVDQYGNSFVTGRSVNANNEYEAVTIKYNPDGVQQWISKYTLTEFFAEPKAMTCDKEGNVYITGFIKDYNGTDYNSYFTVKYDGSGNEMWAVKNTFGANDREEPAGVRTDLAGNVFVAGWIGNAKAYSEDFLTAKYNCNGILKWSKIYNGSGNGNDRLTAFETDYKGDIYVTGYSWIESNRSDFATIKYNTDGIVLWEKHYNNGLGSAYPLNLKIDNSGCIIVTGGVWGSNENYNDFATVKYDSAGIELWSSVYNLPGSYEEANCLAIDAGNNVYIAGGNSTNDYIIVKYNPDGAMQWSANYDRSGGTDKPYSMCVSNSGEVFITGYTTLGNNRDITTIKYNSASKTIPSDFMINK